MVCRPDAPLSAKKSPDRTFGALAREYQPGRGAASLVPKVSTIETPDHRAGLACSTPPVAPCRRRSGNPPQRRTSAQRDNTKRNPLLLLRFDSSLSFRFEQRRLS